jgi:hypothetical protein
MHDTLCQCLASLIQIQNCNEMLCWLGRDTALVPVAVEMTTNLKSRITLYHPLSSLLVLRVSTRITDLQCVLEMGEVQMYLFWPQVMHFGTIDHALCPTNNHATAVRGNYSPPKSSHFN